MQINEPQGIFLLLSRLKFVIWQEEISLGEAYSLQLTAWVLNRYHIALNGFNHCKIRNAGIGQRAQINKQKR